MLVKKQNVDISMRYKLACIYCLEDDIPELWDRLHVKLRESLSFEDCLDKSSQREIVIFWINGIREERWSNPFFSYKSVFESYAKTGNKAATEFFLQKLTPTEREATLVKTAKYVTDPDVFFYLLTEMDERQQREIFRSDPYRVLECFLEWPVQSFFIEMADLLWDFLPKWDYCVLLKIIIDKITYSYKDWDYEKLFGKFWEKSPDVFKNYIINEFQNGFLLSLLLKIKDTENLKLILQDATLEEKEKLIYCDRVQYICQDLIYDDEWELLEFFIRECLPAEEEMVRFKEKFEGCIMSRVLKDHLERNKHKWNQLFGLPVESICKYNMNIDYEEVRSRPRRRRFCNIQ